MSLVGSLEDLSLGDILQIISLSQKSGVLSLDTTGAAGRIVFVSGLVRGAAIKGGPADLRGVLVSGGFLSDDEFTAAVDHAREQGSDVRSAIEEIGGLPAERIESLCREAVESAVMTMFSWSRGDFSFDVRSEPIDGDPELLSPDGLNAQYLAMECARVGDEGGVLDDVGSVSDDDVDDQSGFDEMSAHEMFGVTPDDDVAPATDREEAVDTLAMAGVGKAEAGLSDKASALAAEIMELAEVVETEPVDDEVTLGELDLEMPAAEAALPALADADFPVAPDAPDAFEDEAVATEPEALDLDAPLLTGELAADAPIDLAPAPDLDVAPVASSTPRALVVIDGDLQALEWVKRAVQEEFDPVHIFQQTDPAMARIRQYLVRGKPPVVLIAPGTPVDRLGGVLDAVDFVARLKAQSPRMVVLWLRQEGAPAIARMGAVDGVVMRPGINRIRTSTGEPEDLELAAEFAQQVGMGVSGVSQESQGEVTSGRSISPDALRKLRDATKALTEASSRGEVLPLVIRFAAQVFSRVAMFMVRDGTAVGIAQAGLPLAGGPADAELRELAFRCADSSWMAMVLEQGKAVRGAPGNEGDRQLASLLGSESPNQAYLAPIESTGQVIALLYGDNLPDQAPLGDTSALEVVLHHAGLALDRAALERALREGEG